MASAKISLPGGISVHLDGTPTEVAAVLQDLRQNMPPTYARSKQPADLSKQGEKFQDS